MLQKTCLRVGQLSPLGPLVITNEEYRFIVSEHLRQIGLTPSAVLLEPAARNTAAAIASAAIYARTLAEDPVLLVLPSDHDFNDPEVFLDAVDSAYNVAQSGKLVTFGVVPTRPETGFGYIRYKSTSELKQIEHFVEKPSLELAQQYVNSGDYLWNCGIFMFKASQYLGQLQQHAPDVLSACDRAVECSSRDLDFIRLEKKAFLSSPSVSIDVAVMEKTDNAVVFEIAAGWCDIGSWDALRCILPADKNNNVLSESVLAKDCTNTLAISDTRLVVAVGLENVIVVDTVDALLVADQSRAQELKQVVGDIRQRGFEEATTNRKVYRPWGNFELITRGEKFIVKKLRVNPGAALSMQMHVHRSEHWVVVAGTAKVIKNNTEQRLVANESIYIPLGTRHRLENIGDDFLEVIEVQAGEILSEDDIVRYDDAYGRSTIVE